MKRFLRGFVSLIAVTGVSMLFISHTIAQDGVKMNPGIHKVLIDDESVRVYEVTFAPGQKMAMHSHPRHVVYALTGGTITLTANGKSEAVTLNAGDAVNLEAVSHSTENTGSTEVKLVVVEIKKDMGMKGKMMKDKTKKDKTKEY